MRCKKTPIFIILSVIDQLKAYKMNEKSLVNTSKLSNESCTVPFFHLDFIVKSKNVRHNGQLESSSVWTARLSGEVPLIQGQYSSDFVHQLQQSSTATDEVYDKVANTVGALNPDTSSATQAFTSLRSV